MRALLRSVLPSLFSPGRPDDLEARGSRQLQSGRADAAARAVHEDRLARTPLRAPEESAVRGHVRREDSRALRERDARGKRMNLRLVAQHKLRVRARQTPGRVDAVSDADARDAFAD